MPVATVHRTESKYLLDTASAGRLAHSLDVVLARDPHALVGPYEVRSLYFDALDNTDFYQKLAGTERRKKIRLRCYGPGDQTVKLEAKRKVGESQRKDSVSLTRTDAERLMRGDLAALLANQTAGPQALRLYTEMRLGCYRPVCLIGYCRLAWVHPAHNVRVTLDTRIRYSEARLDLFCADASWQAATWGSVVLEVKHDGGLPGYVSDALRPFGLTRLAVSKYCLCRPVGYEFGL